MTIFFANNLQGSTLVLSEEERQHAIKTLRKREGDTIQVTDGKGLLWEASISSTKNNQFQAEISKVLTQDSNPPLLHILMALPKNPERFEWFLEKTTEIGIGAITPLITHRSEKFFAKRERWQKLLISAMKQSGRLFIPILHPEQKFQDCLLANFENPLIAHCIPSLDKIPLQSIANPSKPTAIFIGPEGDFTEEEIIKAKNKNFTPISLGNSRLRTETAGVVACTVWNFNRL